MLVKTLLQFKRIDLTIASSALKELQLHFCNLTEVVVLLCLFDGCVADEEKEKIVETLLQEKMHHAAFPAKRKGNRKPKFSEEVNEKSSLADLTGEDSWCFFRLLNEETDFFAKGCERLVS